MEIGGEWGGNFFRAQATSGSLATVAARARGCRLGFYPRGRGRGGRGAERAVRAPHPERASVISRLRGQEQPPSSLAHLAAAVMRDRPPSDSPGRGAVPPSPSTSRPTSKPMVTLNAVSGAIAGAMGAGKAQVENSSSPRPRARRATRVAKGGTDTVSSPLLLA